jgi:hypothetical protein
MPHEHERSRIEVDGADRALIEQAAAQLRHGAIRAGYAGIEHKHLAFALALILDELAHHLRDLRPEVRAQAVRGARTARRVTRLPPPPRGPSWGRRRVSVVRGRAHGVRAVAAASRQPSPARSAARWPVRTRTNRTDVATAARRGRGRRTPRRPDRAGTRA